MTLTDTPPTSGSDADEHLVVLSSDCHAGAPTDEYRQYLEAEWHDEFDAWRAKYANPFRDLTDGVKTRNWDDERRTAEQYADGVIGEIVFPNTVPPFFPTGQLIAYPPRSAESYRRRLAGIRAHNRWLADWCDHLPGQRVGLAQVFMNDIDDAVADATWAADNGFRSILMPAVPPDLGVPALYTDHYDPLWRVCAERGLVVTQHGGGGLPNYANHAATGFLMLMEVQFFANRTLWHMLLSGAFHRFPDLKLVMTEQGVAWVPDVLARMDHFWHQMNETGRIGELQFEVKDLLPEPPSAYFARNCYVGASFPTPSDATAIQSIGVDRVMWGSDYPHDEGTHPHSRESLRRTFAGWSPEDLRAVLSGTAADVYGFDLDALAPLAAQYGPTLGELATPLTELPDNASPAFTRA